MFTNKSKAPTGVQSILRKKGSMIGALGAAALLATGCHFNTGSGAPAEGGTLGLSASGSSSSSGSSGLSGTNAPALNPNAKGINPNAYDGAGYPIVKETTTTLPNTQNGIPLSPTLMTLQKTSHGTVLATTAGLTLYMRVGDSRVHSGCYSICTTVWYPWITNGAPQATGGILPAFLGVLTSTENTEQVAYAGHPLYSYSGDHAPGQINGEGLGGIWYAMTPSGNPLIFKNPAATTTTTSGK